jgi:hypothetical protein
MDFEKIDSKGMGFRISKSVGRHSGREMQRWERRCIKTRGV